MCIYIFENAEQCQLEALENGFCFWHDPTINKQGMNLANELSELAKSGYSMEGVALAGANLDNLNLVSHDKNITYSLAKSDLYRCNMRHAHLFRVDLSQASLMKADCTGSNFHFANLDNANLLGAKLEEAKIERVQWGDTFYQEKLAAQAKKDNKPNEAREFFVQAEEVFRHLRKVSELHGLFELAGHFFIKEMTMRRYQLPQYSVHRLMSKAVDVFCGYGERPLRVIGFSLCVIVMFSLIYWWFGIADAGNLISYQSTSSISENIYSFLNSLYFSVVTFTTLGYGDLVPIGISRLFSAVEAFLGSFTIALFVVVFVKKMTR
ncbi:ion channel [Oceaniserpentilla sp. 4NH20-0058]|uniref:ion channel n=1 Tax=Oceaniserpentilla sp. 4NH20-0058 TaxID=3127660 RepID=UPI003104CCA1